MAITMYEEPRWKWLAVPCTLAAVLAIGLLASMHAQTAMIVVTLALGVLRGAAHHRLPKYSVEADAEGVRLDGSLKLPRGRLLDAQPGVDPEQVVLTRHDGSTLTLRAQDDLGARTVLDAVPKLGTAACGRTPTLRDAACLLAFVLTLGFAIVFVAPPILWPLALVSALATAWWLLHLEQIVAGADGFEIRTARERRFVPYGDIARLDRDGVVLKSGARLPLAPDLVATACDPTLRAAYERVRARVGEGLTDAAKAEVDGATVEDVERALSAASKSPTTGYRDAYLPDETLWRVVETGSARPDVRAQAAEAIRARGDTEGVRLRIADIAEATAHAGARERLFRVAEEPAEPASIAEEPEPAPRARAS